MQRNDTATRRGSPAPAEHSHSFRRMWPRYVVTGSCRPPLSPLFSVAGGDSSGTPTT
jgi:hypothetical protein